MKNNRYPIHASLALLFIFSSSMILSACNTVSLIHDNTVTADNSNLPLPKLVVGESFTFDNGSKQTVTHVTHDTVTWKLRNGIERTSLRVPFAPYLSWTSNTAHSTSKTDATNSTLWPPVVGHSAGFNFTQIVTMNDSLQVKEYRQQWQCYSEAKELIPTKIGSFDTFRIVCYRYYKRKIRQTRTFNYAPELDYYVYRHDDYKSRKPQTIYLTKHEFDTSILSDNEKITLGKAVQDALQIGNPKQDLSWQSQSGLIHVLIQVDEAVTDASGLICREYRGSFSVENKKMINHRKACKQNNNLWVQAKLPN